MKNANNQPKRQHSFYWDFTRETPTATEILFEVEVEFLCNSNDLE